MTDAKTKQYLFVSNRDVTISSTQGYAIAFKKGEPTHVPRAMHAEVMEKGIIPVEGEDAAALTEAATPKVLVVPEDPEDRKDAIRAVCEALVARNNAKDFSAGGVPTVASVTSALGWRADAKEIREVWTVMKQKMAEAGQ